MSSNAPKAMLPATLAQGVLRAAMGIRVGKTLADLVSATVAILTEETLRMMIPIKWPGIVGAALAMGIIATSVVVLAPRTPGAAPLEIQADKKVQPAPVPSKNTGVKRRGIPEN
jgi:hypothetical protein